MIRIASFLIAALCVVPAWSSARAQPGSLEVDRLILVGGGLVGGESRVRTSTEVLGRDVETDDSTDLLGSGHVGLQFESPIAKYFVIAYRFSAARYNVDDNTDRNRTWFDFGLSPTATMVFRAGKLALEPRLGMPLGFSLHHWNKDDPDTDGQIARNNPGFHIGVLGGLHLGASSGSGFLSRLGGLVEFGMIHHSGFGTVEATDTKVRLSMNQMVIQAGLSFAF